MVLAGNNNKRADGSRIINSNDKSTDYLLNQSRDYKVGPKLKKKLEDITEDIVSYESELFDEYVQVLNKSPYVD